MDRAQHFYPTWRVSIRWGVSATVVVVLVAVGFSLFGDPERAGVLTGKPPIATRIALLVLLLTITTAAFTLMRRYPAVKVTSEGVIATRGNGFRSRLVRWAEIVRVVPTSMYGVRSLRLLTIHPFPEQLRMPMHLDEISTLRDFVLAQAGAQHPLAIWLTELSARVETRV